MPEYPTLLDFINRRRLFIGLLPTRNEDEKLTQFVNDNGIFNNLDFEKEYIASPKDLKFHVTVWYSKKGQISPGIMQLPEFECQTDGWELLGKNKEHLTIRIKTNEQLARLHHEYGKYGLVSDWPTFKPHLTVCCYYNKKSLPRIAPPKTIRFSEMIIEETIKLDF